MARNRAKRLLVIRLSALGDVAMTVPVINAFTRQHPEVEITVLTRPFFKPIFRNLDRVTVFGADVERKYKGIHGLWRLYRQLNSRKFEAVADLHNVLRTNILKRYFRWSGIPFVQINKGRTEKKELTRSNNKEFKQLKTTFERYADVFRDLGFEVDLGGATLKERETLPEKTISMLGRDRNKWVGIAPFAAFEGKMYPLSQMEEVIRQLNNTDKYKILLFGGGTKESEVLQEIARKDSNVINTASQQSFSEQLALISNLDVMVSMDSGNAHLAAMYGIPTITLWGVTHPYAGFFPFGQDPENALLANREQFPLIPTSVYGNKFPKGYEKAISTIEPAQITARIENVLEL